jgi:hypothetical protein
MAFYTSAAASPAERMRLDENGNLGLGVTPSAWNDGFTAFAIKNNANNLSANGAGYFEISQNAYWNSGWKYVNTATASRYEQGEGKHLWFTAPSGTAGNAITFTQAMTLDASGNLLLGTTSASGRLNVQAIDDSVSGGIRLRGFNDGSANGDRTVFISAISAGGNYNANINYSAWQQIFTTNGSERARIDSSGNLLVGTTSNSINGNTGSGFTNANVTGGSGTLFVYNSASASGDDSPCLALQKAMTTTSSSARFVQFYASGITTPMGGIVGNGASNVQFASISDVREKTNITPISGSLEKVIALRPVEFDWISNGEHCSAGFVAQDVEQVFPEFVVENMSGEGQETRKGLTGGMTGGIIAHLVAAIQEQQAIITALTARVAALESN